MRIFKVRFLIIYFAIIKVFELKILQRIYRDTSAPSQQDSANVTSAIQEQVDKNSIEG